MEDEEKMDPGTPAAAPAPAKGKGMWIGIVVVVIVIVILLAAVFGGLFGAPPAARDTELRLGTVMSLTGGLALFGPHNEKGVKMAIDEINAAGGVLGNNITAFHENDETNPTTGRTAAQKLVTTNDVDAIVGAVGSSICLQVLEVAKANSVFQVSASCTSVALSDTTLTEGWFARTAPPDSLQAAVAANYTRSTRPFTQMAVIGNDNAYGRGLASLFEQEYEAHGGTVTINRIVRETAPPQSATTYVPDLTAVFATSPQAIYLVLYPDDGVLMLREISQSGNATWTNTPLIFSEGLFSGGWVQKLVTTEALNRTWVESFEGTAPGDFVGIYGPQYATWAARYNTKYTVTDGGGLFTPGAYDAAFLIALAAQAAGEATGDGIKSKFRDVANPPGTPILPGEWAKARTEIAAGRDIDYQGAFGAVDMDTRNEPLSGYAVWGVDNSTACPGGATCFNTIKTYSETEVVAIIAGAPPLRIGHAPEVPFKAIPATRER